MAPRISVVIPAFDEEARIAASLAAVAAHLAGRSDAPFDAPEILVADDGSRDGTAGVVQRFAAQSPLPVRLLRDERNRGKGVAVRRGILAAAGEVVLFTDADLSAPIEQAELLLGPVLAGSCDVAIGSRGLDRRLIERHQALPRELLGRSFNLAVRAITRLPIKDTQCGFKAMRRAPVLPLVEALRVESFAFDVELLLLCRAAGLRVEEVPVRWRHQDGSKVRVLRHGLAMLADAAGVVRRMRRGHYDAAVAAAIEAARGVARRS